jgi:hypothetical protein
MRSLISRSLSPALALIQVGGAVHAQDVTIGGPADHANSFPFTWSDFNLPNRYQQVYSASLFSGSIFIDAIRFSNTISAATGYPSAIANGQYLVRFAITNAPVNGLGTVFADNIDGFDQTFFSGVLTSAADGLRIAGATPYRYDPSRGNLLMDVTILSQERNVASGLDGSRSSTDGTSRVFHSYPLPPNGSFPPVADDFGLVTTFETRPGAVTPEPVGTVLLATGLGGLGALRRRRKRTSSHAS